MADFSYWKDALAGKDMTSRTHEADPQLGFFRLRSKNKTTGSISWSPVAYFIDRPSGELTCITGREGVVTPDRANELWSFVCRYPVTEEAYRAVAERNESWPDQDSIVDTQTRGFGDNSGATDDAEILSDQIKSASEGKGKYLKIDSLDKSAQAQSLRSRLLELAGQAKKIHKSQKDPHWNRCGEIDNKWLPLVKEAEGAAAAIKKANDVYLDGILASQRKAEAEAADMMEPEVAAPALPTQVKAAYGRALSVKAVWVLDKIENYDLVYAHFKDRVAIKEALEDLTKRAVKDGEEVPGATRRETVATK